MLARCLASLLTFSCLALKSSSTCCCTRKYASEFCRDFLSPSASRRITSDRCLSTWSWDSRSWTDSGNEFEELVPAVVASNGVLPLPLHNGVHRDRTLGLSQCLQYSFYQLSWRPTGMSHYLEPYLHYFLYHCITGYSSPIFYLHSKRETNKHITGLQCSIWNSFW